MLYIFMQKDRAFLWIPKLFGKRCIVTIHGIDQGEINGNTDLVPDILSLGNILQQSMQMK